MSTHQGMQYLMFECCMHLVQVVWLSGYVIGTQVYVPCYWSETQYV